MAVTDNMFGFSKTAVVVYGECGGWLRYWGSMVLSSLATGSVLLFLFGKVGVTHSASWGNVEICFFKVKFLALVVYEININLPNS